MRYAGLREEMRTVGKLLRAVGKLAHEDAAPVVECIAVRALVGEIHHFVRIIRQIEELLRADARQPDIFPPPIGQVLHPTAERR